jgi:hypothetical protein
VLAVLTVLGFDCDKSGKISTKVPLIPISKNPESSVLTVREFKLGENAASAVNGGKNSASSATANDPNRASGTPLAMDLQTWQHPLKNSSISVVIVAASLSIHIGLNYSCLLLWRWCQK